MTLASDILHLTPTERLIIDRGTRLCNQGLSFSCLDFPEPASGTIRNSFSSLVRKGLIERYDRSSVAFYWVTGVPKPATVVTPTHTVVDTRDLRALLAHIKMGERAVHDIRLLLRAPGAYCAALERASPARSAISRDAPLFSMARGLTTGRAIAHKSDAISIFVGCSLQPFPLTLEGYTNLAAFVGEVRGRLESSCGADVRIPEVSSWLVIQWHYGIDGRSEVSGPRFNLPLGQFGEAVLSAYIKDLPSGRTLRVESKESPKKPLPEAFLEKLEVGST
jgi:hypothetical protein